MSNKSLLIVIFILLSVSLATTYLDFLADDTIAEGSSLLATLLGGYLLIGNSDIKTTIWWRFINFAIGVLILGVLFKILHFTGADELLFAGCAGIVISYLLRFITKRSKNHLDILKALTVLSYGTITALVIFHYISKEYSMITVALFWATLIDFAYLEWKKSPSVTTKK